MRYSYGTAIRAGFHFLLQNYPEVFIIGQGLWAPWYVGNSMTELEKEFGTERVIDSPISENACNGAAVGASLVGMRAVVVHPRMDFLVLGMDAIVNQAANWSSMFGGQASPALTVRAIINRGGEQGAQHSQALHNWFAHIPGLRVVMPSSVQDARDLLIASVLSDHPVVYIDDRWLYEREAELAAAKPVNLSEQRPEVVRGGSDVTVVGVGYSTYLAEQAAEMLGRESIQSEIIDVRVLKPFYPERICESVAKTGRLVVVDGGWRTGGFAAEVVASVCEAVPLKSPPRRVTLPDVPAPTSAPLEKFYYPTVDDVVAAVRQVLI